MKRYSWLGVALLLVPGLHLGAVEPGKPSKTAIQAMALRAIGSHDPDPTVRNPDWLAERFLGAEERAQIPDLLAIRALSEDYREVMKRGAGPVRIHTVRTKFIDEHLLKAVEAGAVQVVNLGAGFDSRAYRFRQALRNVKVFELDYGPTQEYKRRRVAEVIGAPPPNLIFVPIDFTREKLVEVLRRAGYRRDRKTFFIWEGVTMYIPREAVLDTLRYIASNEVPGSAVVFDYGTESGVDGVSPQRRAQRAMLRSWGEPVIFGIPDGTTQQFVKDTGLDLVENLGASGPEAVQRYLTRKDGTVMGELTGPLLQPAGAETFDTVYFALAAVPGPSRAVNR